MIGFDISAAIDPRATDLPDYNATYVIHVGGGDVYRVDLHRGPGTVGLSHFETLAAGCPAFDIEQTSRVGLRKIDVRSVSGGARFGEIRGLKLYFDGPNQVVGCHDPASLMQRMVGRLLRGRPERFEFQRAVDRAPIGWIEAPPAVQGPWPVRMVKALRRAKLVEETCVWQGQLDCPDLDFRPFAAMAVVLHSDRGDGITPTVP